MSHIIKLLKKLVETPSTTNSEQLIGGLYLDILKRYGFEVKTQNLDNNRKNIFAYKNKSKNKKSILFYGHQDTVHPVPEFENPYELIIKANLAYGLGSYDMKGGIVSFLEATKSTSRYVKIFLAVGEEGISDGAWHAVNQNYNFFDDVELIISAEPNFGLGLNGITTSRTGRIIFEIKAKGKSAHIANYQNGENAIYILTKFINNFQKKWDILFKDPKTIAQIRKISGTAIGMSICQTAHAELEVLMGEKDEIEQIHSKISQFCQKISPNLSINIKERKTPYLEGYSFDSFPYQEKINKIIKKNTQLELKLHHRTSVGDDNVLASLDIPVITWGPDGKMLILMKSVLI